MGMDTFMKLCDQVNVLSIRDPDICSDSTRNDKPINELLFAFNAFFYGETTSAGIHNTRERLRMNLCTEMAARSKNRTNGPSNKDKGITLQGRLNHHWIQHTEHLQMPGSGKTQHLAKSGQPKSPRPYQSSLPMQSWQ